MNDNFTLIHFVVGEMNESNNNRITKFYQDGNTLYANIFVKCNFNKNDILFKDVLPQKIDVEILNVKYISQIQMSAMMCGFYVLSVSDPQLNISKSLIIPNSYFMPNSDFLNFMSEDFIFINNVLIDNLYKKLIYDNLQKIILKLSQANISFNIKIGNLFFFITNINILMFFMTIDKVLKYYESISSYLKHLINILPDLECNITDGKYTYNVDFVFITTSAVLPLITPTIKPTNILKNKPTNTLKNKPTITSTVTSTNNNSIYIIIGIIGAIICTCILPLIIIFFLLYKKKVKNN
jgi:hypothetical protein